MLGPGATTGVGYLAFKGKSVCHKGFGLQDAAVVCTELCGTGVYGSVVRGTPTFGETIANQTLYPYGYSDINCLGNEANLDSCDYLKSSSCASSHGVGIRCYADGSGIKAGILFSFYKLVVICWVN